MGFSFSYPLAMGLLCFLIYNTSWSQKSLHSGDTGKSSQGAVPGHPQVCSGSSLLSICTLGAYGLPPVMGTDQLELGLIQGGYGYTYSALRGSRPFHPSTAASHNTPCLLPELAFPFLTPCPFTEPFPGLAIRLPCMRQSWSGHTGRCWRRCSPWRRIRTGPLKRPLHGPRWR